MFDPVSLCQELPHSVIIICIFLYHSSEWLLGKTRYGSWMGLLIEHPSRALIKKAKSKNEQNN